jgi:hypothetical protein
MQHATYSKLEYFVLAFSKSQMKHYIFTATFGQVISADSSKYLLLDEYCSWKLSSGNLYTFIRPNQEHRRKMQI